MPAFGRWQAHDERSRAFALAPVTLPTEPVLHERRIPIFDQGDVGCCTAAAQLGMLATGPTDIGRGFTMSDVRDLYSAETRIDDRWIPGRWPPEDTGSAGIYACKVSRARGWITTYRHAFTLATCLGRLGRQPVSIGIPWLDSMMSPRRGLVTVDRGSEVLGGHQVCLDGIDPGRGRVRFANSWSNGWGVHGWAWLAFADLEWLLRQGGDAVTVTIPQEGSDG